ncbi:MAG TPA: group III truncated hemoglobin [Ferruginibacter sp.]|nr:group III truncated hemoglobin [Ferruginibacter sp.]HRE62505.1 group III truncated hemoglobin [Ferruginibacter sp.]
MKADISSKEDVQTIVHLFYDKVIADEVLGVFFTKVIAINWNKHLPAMCAFWENVLFFTGEYEGNPLVAHRKLHAIHPTTTRHFERWIDIFDETIDEHFAGPNANKMKDHAKAIAAVMLQKI